MEVQTRSGEVHQADTFAEGKSYYVGCGLSQSFYDKFTAEVLKGLVPEGIKVPDEVEITLREKEGVCRGLFKRNKTRNFSAALLKKGFQYGLLPAQMVRRS